MSLTHILLLRKSSVMGNTGDIVKVKSGYARNFLLPRNIGIIISRKNKKCINHYKRIIEEKNNNNITSLLALSDKLKTLELTIKVQATSQGKLFGSITSREVAGHLKKKNIYIDNKQVVLSNPIKTIGSYNIKITLNGKITSQLHVNVIR